MKLSDLVLLHHFPRVGGVSHVLKGLGGVRAGVLNEDLLAARVLKKDRHI